MSAYVVTTIQGLTPSDVTVRLLAEGTAVVDLGDRRAGACAQLLGPADEVRDVLVRALLDVLRVHPGKHPDELEKLGTLIVHGYEPDEVLRVDEGGDVPPKEPGNS